MNRVEARSVLGLGVDNGLNGEVWIPTRRTIVKQLEADDSARNILHEDDLVARLRTDVFFARVVPPDGERVAHHVMNHPDRVHTDSPALSASVE